MRARERPAAQPGVFRKRRLLGELADRAEPALFQDANIEFDPYGLIRRPAEKNVGRRLHHPLPLDHAPALRALVGKLLRESLEDGALSLLDLQEERLPAAAEEEPDNTDRADGSDAHRFEGDICQSIAVEEHGPVGRERFAVERKATIKVDLAASQRLWTDMEDLRRLVGDPGFARGDEVGKVVVP